MGDMDGTSFTGTYDDEREREGEQIIETSEVDWRYFHPWTGVYLERRAEELRPGYIVVERSEEQIDLVKIERVSLVLQEIPDPVPGTPPVPRVVAHIGQGWAGDRVPSFREYSFGTNVEVLP